MTRLDHDGNVSPWLQLADDRLVVRFADLRGGLHARPRRPRARSSATDPRGRVPVGLERASARSPTSRGSSSSRTTRARSPGWTPSTTRRTARSTSPRLGVGRPALLAVQVLRAAPGPLLRRARELLERWRPYKVRPAPDEPLAARLRDRARTRTSCWPASSPRSRTSSRSAGTRSRRTSARCGALPRRPAGRDRRCTARTTDGRARATFAVTVPGRPSFEVADALAEHDSPSGRATTTRSR